MKFIKNILLGSLLLIPLFSNAQVGNPAPNFTVTDTHGNTHTLYDYLEDGKVVVLDFFYTTCAPCQFYAPQVNLAYEKYGCNTADVIFMSIDYGDTDSQVLAYDETYEIEFPSISGLEGGGNNVVSLYNILGFPTFYVIDSSKVIVERIDPPTLQVFDFRFNELGIEPADCSTTAVKAMPASASLNLFPNPVVDDKIHIQMTDSVSGLGIFEVYDFTGKLVQTGKIELGSSTAISFNRSDLSSGIFLLKILPAGVEKIYWGKFIMK